METSTTFDPNHYVVMFVQKNSSSSPDDVKRFEAIVRFMETKVDLTTHSTLRWCEGVPDWKYQLYTYFFKGMEKKQDLSRQNLHDNYCRLQEYLELKLMKIICKDNSCESLFWYSNFEQKDEYLYQLLQLHEKKKVAWSNFLLEDSYNEKAFQSCVFYLSHLKRARLEVETLRARVATLEGKAEEADTLKRKRSKNE